MNWNVDYKHVTEKEEDQILWCCSEPSLTDCSSPELSDLIEVLISKSNMTWLQSPFLSLSFSLYFLCPFTQCFSASEKHKSIPALGNFTEPVTI